MIRKNHNILITITLVFISFYYTSKVISISKENDPIMKEIIKYKEIIKDTKQEATEFVDEIIPGLNGEEIDVEKSYSKMKKIGKFDKNLLVYQEAYPENTLQENYDKFIISGNKSRNNVSIIIKINDTSYVEDILRVLNQKNIKATFFVDKSVFNNSIDLIKLIEFFGNDVELYSDNYSVYEVNKYSSMLKLVANDKLSYCLNTTKDSEILDNCKTSKLYSIVPSIISDNYLYNSVKNSLQNGSIILIENKKNILRELAPTINYIEQKGKKIVPLKKLLEE